MYRSGHYGVALLAYAPVLYVLGSLGRVVAAAAGLALVLALTPLPDADHDIPLISHRGVTHTLLFAGVVGVLVGGAAWLLTGPAGLALAPEQAVELTVGAGGVAAFAILAHLLADALTPMGVAALWPVSSTRYSLGLTPADSTVWNVGLFALGVFTTAAAVVLAIPLA
ncbi:metal-dependent hydrolase [Halobacterium noricense]|uniref:metal-dependent hydrolase n=1 Tax=Halobacterium noricense TaxID=223182 RepID=UPI001E31B530|nr:metal-dependent hydrolase [Halobacterium noricense]UHH26207.1 metal-dependent hydrolase [Halobacterium noricense]